MARPTLSTGLPTGTGSVFQAPITQAIASATRFVLPVGEFIVYSLGADVRLQVFDGAVWQNVTAAGVGIPYVASDGTNVALINNGAGIENALYIQIG